MTIIPKILREHINNSYPAHVCLIGTVRMDMLRLPRAVAPWWSQAEVTALIFDVCFTPKHQTFV